MQLNAKIKPNSPIKQIQSKRKKEQTIRSLMLLHRSIQTQLWMQICTIAILYPWYRQSDPSIFDSLKAKKAHMIRPKDATSLYTPIGTDQKSQFTQHRPIE
jgi:hypothetical protein